eukprot:6204145-Pleurochrysis_carterae.AAC.11
MAHLRTPAGGARTWRGGKGRGCTCPEEARACSRPSSRPGSSEERSFEGVGHDDVVNHRNESWYSRLVKIASKRE